jgi:hypothetical protein
LTLHLDPLLFLAQLHLPVEEMVADTVLLVEQVDLVVVVHHTQAVELETPLQPFPHRETLEEMDQTLVLQPVEEVVPVLLDRVGLLEEMVELVH